MSSIALIVLTLNEDVNLPYCLDSVKGLATRIFVVDSGSTDKTHEIAKRHGAELVVHPFETQADQFNWALASLPIDTEWILRLDADEYLLPELRDEIRARLPILPPSVSGLYMKRRVFFQGRWIRHGGYYPTWLLRLFRTGTGSSEQLEMDEHLIVAEGRTERLEHDFVDQNRKGLAFFTHKHEEFARREASVLMRWEGGISGRTGQVGRLNGAPPERRRWVKKNLYARLPMFHRAFLYFFYRYFLRLGFLDGREGLMFHVLQGFWYRFYVDAKLAESCGTAREQ